MGWWQRLLSVETPGDAQLEGLDWTLRAVLPPSCGPLGFTVAGGFACSWPVLLSGAASSRPVAGGSLLILTRTCRQLACSVSLSFGPIQCAVGLQGKSARAAWSSCWTIARA